MRIISPYAQKTRYASRLHRQKQRNRAWTVVAMGLVILLFVAHHLLTEKNWYLLERIRIVGTDRLDHRQVLGALNLHVGSDNLQELPQEQLEQTLEEKLVYVLDAEISKELMQGTLTIHITERTPSVLLRYRRADGGEIYRLTDLDGAVLESANGAEAYEGVLPVIDLTGQAVPEPGTRLISQTALVGLELVRMIREKAPELEERLIRILPEDPNKVKLVLTDCPEVWLAPRRIEDGLLDLKVLLEKSDVQRTSVAYIDARFKGMIYCGG